MSTHVRSAILFYYISDRSYLPNGPGNGFPPLQTNESPEDDATTALTQSYQDSKEGTKGGINNYPQIIYGNYRHGQTSFQIKVYNFLERPTGWKCFAYHFTV